MTTRHGWICPRCDKVLSPDVKGCDCTTLLDLIGKPLPSFPKPDPIGRPLPPPVTCVSINPHPNSWLSYNAEAGASGPTNWSARED